MSALTRPFASVWARVRRLVSLIHGYDDLRETYGDNPNELSEDARQVYRAFGTNGVNMQ